MGSIGSISILRGGYGRPGSQGRWNTVRSAVPRLAPIGPACGAIGSMPAAGTDANGVIVLS